MKKALKAKNAPLLVPLNGWPQYSYWMENRRTPEGRIVDLGAKQDRTALLEDPTKQKRSISGHDMRKELADKPVMNACFADFVLKRENKARIPEEWRGWIDDEKLIPFQLYLWGTICKDTEGKLRVSYLYWGGTCWWQDWAWVDGHWFTVDKKKKSTLYGVSIYLLMGKTKKKRK